MGHGVVALKYLILVGQCGTWGGSFKILNIGGAMWDMGGSFKILNIDHIFSHKCGPYYR